MLTQVSVFATQLVEFCEATVAVKTLLQRVHARLQRNHGVDKADGCASSYTGACQDSLSANRIDSALTVARRAKTRRMWRRPMRMIWRAIRGKAPRQGRQYPS